MPQPPYGTNGRPGLHNCIKAGLVISNEEGHRWFEQQYHRQDTNVPLRLGRLLEDGGIAIGRSSAPPPRGQESGGCDFMVVTQMQYGQWINDAPDGYEEVVQAELKAHLSVLEENAFGKTSGFEGRVYIIPISGPERQAIFGIFISVLATRQARSTIEANKWKGKVSMTKTE
ncbi:hypothetical protein K443DRAFT_124317 [Laccaria amethystina LaAM-08-1]|uniref:Uncharacterized protein n=1 Tax=Laccaria amethystina LaAM-08-1 TaxID=1095629 RepID=A0A0C9XKW6_9AGAR|nr:hypothetical protein K443DRAFT_124317 [Laccaria amethystina LaAM-08-1]